MAVQIKGLVEEETSGAVRERCGVFDIFPHGCASTLQGDGVRAPCKRLVPTDLDRKSGPRSALHRCCSTRRGGIRDDLIIYDQGRP